MWRLYQNQRLLNFNKEMSGYTLKSASKLYFSDTLNVRRCVLENLEEETELIDYHTNVEWAKNHINNWVAKVTEGQIQEFIKSLSPHSTVTFVST